VRVVTRTLRVMYETELQLLCLGNLDCTGYIYVEH